MITHNFLHLAVICTAFFGMLSKAQFLAPNGSIPLDPFLDEEEFEKDYSFIISFKFHMREEMLPQLFTEIATHNTPCAFQGCNISLLDIVEATRIWIYTPEIIAEAINTLHINPTNVFAIPLVYNITPELVESLLQTFGLKFGDIYTNFVHSLLNPIQTIPDVLNILNVNVLDFTNANLYANDSVKLKVLSTGNYSQTNVNAVLNITNKTTTDLLKLLPLNVIAKQLKKLNANEFTTFVEILGVTTSNLLDFYQYLNITPINFLSYPPFINIISNFYDRLNAQEVLGVFVSKNTIVTSNTAGALTAYQNQTTDLIKKKYVKFHAELVENPLVQYVVTNFIFQYPVYYSQEIGYVEVENDVVIEVAKIGQDFNKTMLINCTYITKFPFGGLHSETLNPSQITLKKNEIFLTKTNNTMYNLGSPLFCRDKLYGLAIENSAEEIKFFTFMRIIPGTATTTTTTGSILVGTTSTTTGSATMPTIALSYYIFNTLLALLVLKLSL